MTVDAHQAVVEHMRHLTADHPDSVAELVSALQNLGDALADQGRYDEAADAAAECVTVLQSRPLTSHLLVPYCLACSSLANWLDDSGRIENVEVTRRQEAESYRHLVAACQPDQMAEIGGLLNQLIDFNIAVERLRTARVVALTAVELGREGLRHDRTAALYLARSLLTLVKIRMTEMAEGGSGTPAELLGPLQEANDLAEQVAADHPDVARENLADAVWLAAYVADHVGDTDRRDSLVQRARARALPCPDQYRIDGI